LLWSPLRLVLLELSDGFLDRGGFSVRPGLSVILVLLFPGEFIDLNFKEYYNFTAIDSPPPNKIHCLFFSDLIPKEINGIPTIKWY
jgi:hypothetical protein